MQQSSNRLERSNKSRGQSIKGEWVLLLVICMLASAVVSNPVPQGSSSSAGSLVNMGNNPDIINPCPGIPIQDNDPCNQDQCQDYIILIGLFLDEVKKIRDDESTGLAESGCQNMSIINGSLITLEEGDLQCSNRHESDMLAHKAIVVHQAYASVLYQQESTSQSSFSKVNKELKNLSCTLMCHCRSLNSTELEDFAQTVSINAPSETTHRIQLGCIVLRSVDKTLNTIKSYLTSCQ